MNRVANQRDGSVAPVILARITAPGYPVAMKRYHLTTFGCQMNEHDSERMKGMLESLGYGEAPERAKRT